MPTNSGESTAEVCKKKKAQRVFQGIGGGGLRGGGGGVGESSLSPDIQQVTKQSYSMSSTGSTGAIVVIVGGRPQVAFLFSVLLFMCTSLCPLLKQQM